MKWSSLLSALLFGALPSVAAEPELKLLFLGDNGHHEPAVRFKQLEPALRERGVALTYTDVPDDLNPQTLAGYDGLVVYANIDAISPEQERALLDFVAQGKGFVPLHCATYCFRNSDAVVALMGGQFLRHGGQEFTTEIAAPNHPVMKGFSGFRSWDETYIHTKHNEKDRTVLEYRVQGEQAEGRTREPWTWVRMHGKGRVFYTAWGHDQRTWSHPGFHNLVERGIRWACGKDPSVVPAYRDRDRFDVLPMTSLPNDLPPFEYVDVGPKIPHYTPGEEWGTQGEAYSLMQKPLPAEESLKRLSVPVGFHVELFAAEGDNGFQGKPIAMTWDERGRLWVCETVDYPNNLQPPDEGDDRIRILEDADGDGRADRSIVFADRLSIPTSIAFSHGGAIVQDGTRTLYLKDADGDDVADLRETLITGWNMGDTHGGVSNFQYGLDNWIWAMQGYNASEPVVNGEKQPGFRMGFFRFHVERGRGTSPRVAELEFVRSTNNNTWGLGISEEGIVFGSTANHNPSVYMPIPNRYYERVRGWGPEQLGTIADSYLFKAITPKVRQVDQFGGYTAGAGHALYTARTYPEQFWNRTAFVCEPTGHLVGTFVLMPRGADFKSTSPMNLVAGDDEWFAPIMAEVGPDGHVWILDWYNYIVQHNPTPIGFQTGKGNAYETDLRDKTHGRVYRIVYDNAQNRERQRESQSAPLSAERPGELVGALRRDNLFWRRHAQRLLVERGRTDVVPDLLKLVEDVSVDSTGLNVGAIHALWTLHGLGVIHHEHPKVMNAVHAALRHPSAGVRRNALAVLPANESSVRAIDAAQVCQDRDPQVVLAALLALADMPASPLAGRLVARDSFDAARIMSDRWLADAVTSAAAVHAFDYLAELANLAARPGSPPLSSDSPSGRVVLRVAEHLARGRMSSEELARLVTILSTSPASMAALLVSGLSAGWPKNHEVALPDQTDESLAALLEKLPPGSQGELIRLGKTWGSRRLEAKIGAILQSLLAVVADANAAPENRVASARQAVELEPHSLDMIKRLLEVVGPQASPELSMGLLQAISISQADGLGDAVLTKAATMAPSVRQFALRTLLARPGTTAAVLDAIADDRLSLDDLALDQKQALAVHPDENLRNRALKLLKDKGSLPNPDRENVLQELLPLAKRTGDAAAGKAVFKKQCAKCHRHSGEGEQIGPDLTGMAVHPKEELMVHILDPSRSVEGNFRVYTVVMNDGRVLTGLLAAESKTSLELFDSEGKKQTLVRDDIEELVASKKSLMPEGFEKQMTRDEFADLLEFLTQKGKYVPLPLGKAATAVSTKGMFYFEDADVERLIFDDWGPKFVGDVPFHLVDPQGDRVLNAILLFGPIGQITKRMPKSAVLPCNMPAKAVHFLSGVSGWGFPLGQKGSVSLIVRLHYADGDTEDHELKNGEHFADYIRRVDVPGSKFAFALRGQQIRYFSIEPKRPEKIERIELVKGPDDTAPVVMAVTVETR